MRPGRWASFLIAGLAVAGAPAWVSPASPGSAPAVASAGPPAKIISASSEGRGAGASSWTGLTRERMTRDALKIAPPSLAHLILKHEDALAHGLDSTLASEGTAPHRQDSADVPLGAASALDVVTGRAVAALDAHSPIADVVFHLGVIAHVAADLNDPLLTAPQGATAPFGADFASYVERNLGHFQVVFYGYDTPGATDANGAASAAIARRYFDHLARAYAARAPGAEFDVRSIPFGVAAICYSRAVTDIARAWLRVWTLAHGDIGGTPYLAAAPPVMPAGPPLGPVAVAPPVTRPPVHAPAPAPAAAPPAAPSAEPGSVEAAQGTETASAGADGAAPITKVILGRSRKKKGKFGYYDPNAPAETDPNAVPPADPNTAAPRDPNAP